MIRSNRRRLQVIHVGVRKYQQAPDSTRKQRRATPDHPRTGGRRIINVTALAALKQSTSRIAEGRTAAMRDAAPVGWRTHAATRLHHILLDLP